MSNKCIRSSLLAVAMQMLWVAVAGAVEARHVQHYPNTHPPLPQQPAGPPRPGQSPPSGIDASGPVFVEVEDIDIFNQPDLSTYGAGVPSNTGWWFSYDRLRYTVSVPDKTLIGDVSIVEDYFTGTSNYFGATGGGGSNSDLQRGTVDNTWINNGPSNGYRWEGGFIDGQRGFFLSAWRLYDNDQRVTYNNVHVPFRAPTTGVANVSLLQGFVDPAGLGFDADLNGNGIFGRYGANPQPGVEVGPPDFGDLATLPIMFTELSAFNHREIWGTEANYIWRLRPGYKGGVWEIFVGPRYLKFDERLVVSGVGGILDTSFWNTRANNNLVGGQIGLRYAKKHGRVTFSTEGRFLAAANLQRLTQEGQIASNTIPGAAPTVNGLSLDLAPTGWFTGIRKTEWSPLGELRAELAYQLFNKVSFTVGWTGIVTQGIARPTGIIDYNLPSMGLLVDNGFNEQTLFMQGFTLGVELNR